MARRDLAALYCDLTAKEFEQEVIEGRLPAPVLLGGKEHWSLAQIDAALDRLTGEAVPDWRSEQPGLRNAA